jgi:hypothetical protein
MTEQTASDDFFGSTSYLEAITDPDDGSTRILSEISSANFDGVIPEEYVTDINPELILPGQYMLNINPDGSEEYVMITKIEDIDDSETVTIGYTLWYIDRGAETFKEILLTSPYVFTDGNQVKIKRDLWAQKVLNKYGWTITPEGNAIFSNIAVRGTIEATDGYFDGNLTIGDPLDPVDPGSMRIGKNVDGTIESPGTENGIFINTTNYWYDNGKFSLGTGTKRVYFDGTDVTITSDVIIEGGLTADSLTIGTSPTILKIDENVKDDNDGIYINDYNYWYTDGRFAAGGVAGGIVWNNTNFIVTGKINATSGYIGTSSNGWNINSSSIVSNGNSSLVVGSGTSTIKLNATGINTSTYIGISSGTPEYNNSNTPFYADAAGRFSINNRVVWDPSAQSGAGVLTIDGFLRGYINDTTPVTANPGNTMGFGLFTEGSTGVGMKIDDNNYWFANEGNPRIRVGSESNFMSYEADTDILEVTGKVIANSGNIGGFNIEGSVLSSGNSNTYIALSSQTSVDPSEEEIEISISSIDIEDEEDDEDYDFSTIGFTFNNDELSLEELDNLVLGIENESQWVYFSGISNTTTNPDLSLGFTVDSEPVLFKVWDYDRGPTTTTIYVYGEDSTYISSGIQGVPLNDSEIITPTGVSMSFYAGGYTKYSIWAGVEDPLEDEPPFSVTSTGRMTARSGKLGGFLFYSPDDATFRAGSLRTDLESAEWVYGSSPFDISISPDAGIIMSLDSSLEDSIRYWTNGQVLNTSSEIFEVVKNKGLYVQDATGSYASTTINPFVGFRSESVSAINFIKNPSFEYKVNVSDLNFTASTVGWTNIGGTIDSTNISNGRYPSLAYGQRYIGFSTVVSPSTPRASSNFMSTSFFLDPDGSKNKFILPGGISAKVFSAGIGKITFAFYLASENGLMGTNYGLSYPVEETTLSYINNSGATVTKTISQFATNHLTLGQDDTLFADPSGDYDISPDNTLNKISVSSPILYNSLSDTLSFSNSGQFRTKIRVNLDVNINSFISDINFNQPLTINFPRFAHPIEYAYFIPQNSYTTITRGSYPVSTNASYELYPYIIDNTFEQFYVDELVQGNITTSTTNLYIEDIIEGEYVPASGAADLYTGQYDYPLDEYTSSATTIQIYGDARDAEYSLGLPSGSQNNYLAVVDFDGEILEYIRVTNVSVVYDPDFEDNISTLTIVRDQLNAVDGSNLLPVALSYDIEMYRVERISVVSTTIPPATKIVTDPVTMYNQVTASDYEYDYEVKVLDNQYLTTGKLGFDEFIGTDNLAILFFDGSSSAANSWGSSNGTKPNTWSYKPSVVVAQFGGDDLAKGGVPDGLQNIKSVGFLPPSYLLTYPSLYITETQTGNNELILSGGKYSTTSSEAKISLSSTSSSSSITLSGVNVVIPGNAAINSLNVNSTTPSTSTTTGALIVQGGLGVSKDSYFPSIYTSNWFRSTGQTGWYSQTYGGGWYMTDTTYIRAYNNKSVYTGGTIWAAGRIKGTANYKEAAYTGVRTASSSYSAAATATLSNVAANSSVLLMVTGSFNPSTSNTYVNVYIARGTTRISYVATVQASTAGANQPISLAVIDALAATGTQAYTVFIKSTNGTADWGADTGALRLTALELF